MLYPLSYWSHTRSVTIISDGWRRSSPLAAGDKPKASRAGYSRKALLNRRENDS